MDDSKRNFIEFLTDIKRKDYDKEFASFNASNLIMQEGIIDYDINLNDDKIAFMVIDFFIKLDAYPIDQNSFKEMIEDLIETFSSVANPEKMQIVFVLYKKDIKQLYNKYTENKISIESLRSALRRYCDGKDDFSKLINLASV